MSVNINIICLIVILCNVLPYNSNFKVRLCMHTLVYMHTMINSHQNELPP